MSLANKTVFVGLSGGVDSSVAAARLLAQGYNVVGVFIKVWHPDFLVCNWEAERIDAMRVAAHLDIPFLTCDAEAAYKHGVAEYFISEYKAGRTPNPDVMCNKTVKFGAFLDFARAHGADYVATGHYAQKSQPEGSDPSGWKLLRGVDENKDQSYFLWTLTQDQLSRILLPVGNSPKPEIRKEAEKLGIPVAEKKDSQGVCFLGHIDIPEFLSHYITLEEGDVLDEAGKIIGKHRGAFVYTIGQRHGFTISTDSHHTTPHFVISKNIGTNTITVSQTQPEIKKNGHIMLSGTNWIAYVPSIADTIELQTRYRQTPVTATIIKIDKDSVTLALNETHEMPTAGQSCVLFKDAQCLGGGIIV